MSVFNRIKNGWNAFMTRDPPDDYTHGGSVYYSRPDSVTVPRGVEKTIINSIYSRIAVDVAQLTFRHCRVDENDHFKEVIDDGLNRCLTISANKDQIGMELIQDAVETMLSTRDGVVAIAPIDTDDDPDDSEGFKVVSLRVGTIVEWAPDEIKIDAYNDRTGKHEEIWMQKSVTAIIQNPFRSVMNQPNSVIQRLIRKLSIMDSIDEAVGRNKLDLIIQLPYPVRGENRKQQAEARRKELQDQLKDSEYGVAYTDGTEHIVQLNRSLENNLLKQIEYLTNLAYSQLSITQSILDGTANDATMMNYYGRTIEVIASKLATEMTRKFLSKTAITQKQRITFFRDPFRLVPIAQIGTTITQLTNAAILSSNESRQIIGIAPVQDTQADQLSNKNITPGGATTQPDNPITDGNEEDPEEEFGHY